MSGKFQRSLQALVKPLLAMALVVFLVLGRAPGANAGGVNAPGAYAPGAYAPGAGGWIWNRGKPTALAYAPPSRLYGPGRGPSSGESIGFPLLLPFFGFGGGSLVTLLIAIAVANFLGNFRGEHEADEQVESSSLVSVTRLSVVLLARGRHLQTELESLAASPEDSSPLGLRETLQEASLALLRHPEYWVYGSVKTQQARLVTVRAMFERLALAERTKIEPENLFAKSDRLPENRDKKRAAIAIGGNPPHSGIEESGHYIIVTLMVGLEGNLALPGVNGREDLRQALSQISEIDSDRLEAVEIILAPQAREDTLTKDEILALDPNFKLI